MGVIEVVIYVGGTLLRDPVVLYQGGKQIVCKDKDIDFMSLMELKRGIRYIGFRDHVDIFLAFEEDNVSSLYALSSDVDLFYLLGQLGDRNSIVFFVTHGESEFDDPLYDGYSDSYFMNNKRSSWEESENIGILEDTGELGIPSDRDTNDEANANYNPTLSDLKAFSNDDQVEVEPLYMDRPEVEVDVGHIEEPNSDSDDEHLHIPLNSDDDEVDKRAVKFKYWNRETDCDKPFKLELGMMFKDSVEFKNCLQDYVIQEGFMYRMKPNEKHRVVAKCSLKCGWEMRANTCPKANGFRIKTITQDHTCPRVTVNWRVTYSWIASKIIRMVRANVDCKIKAIRNLLKEKWHIDVSKQKCYRAKVKALIALQGEENSQYARIRDYYTVLMGCNPGSSTYLYTPYVVFARMYIYLEAYKRKIDQSLSRSTWPAEKQV